MEEASESNVEEVEDLGKDSPGKARRWKIEIDLSEKELKDFHELSDEAFDSYLNSDDARPTNSVFKPLPKFNVFWSNIQTMQSALYSQTPLPQIERRFRDKDPIGRLASETLERATSIQVDNTRFDPVMLLCRDDWSVGGLGIAWIRYEPTYGKDGETETLEYEEVCVDYLHRKDFIWSPARVWDEVRWVAKILRMTRSELKKRFKKGKDIPLDLKSKAQDEDTVSETEHEFFQKAKIYEIWDKDTKKVYWISKSFPEVLDEVKDPLGLKGFFPCPKPLFGTQGTDSLVPTPDFHMYKDQLMELNETVARSSGLLKNAQVRGVYDEQYGDEIQNLFKLRDGGMKPIKNWPSFMQSGGLKGVVDFFPLDTVVEGLGYLAQARGQVKQELDEVSGFSDVVRGQSSPWETKGAQEIKTQFVGVRLRDKQREMQRFCRDVIAIVAEIIAEKFEEETLRIIVQDEIADDPQAQQMFPAAVKLLRNDVLRRFRIDIETDSTIELDRNQEKQSGVEFINATSMFFDKAMQVVQTNPTAAPLMFKMLQFFVRRFKVGRELEGSVEQTIQSYQQQLQKPPQPPPPDPKMVEVQQKGQLEQMKMQQQMQVDQAKSQQDAQALQQEFQLKEQELQAEMQLKKEQMLEEMKIKREEMLLSVEIEREKMRSEAMLKRMDMESQLPELDMPQASPQRAKFFHDEQGRRCCDLMEIVHGENGPQEVPIKRAVFNENNGEKTAEITDLLGGAGSY